MLYECLLLFDIQERGLRSFVGHRPHVSTFCLCDATQCPCMWQDPSGLPPPFQHNESYQKLGSENGRDTRLSCCSCPPQKCISGTALNRSETICCLPTLTQWFHYLTASARLSGTTSAMIFLYMWRGLFFVVHSSFQLHTFVILDLYWQLKYCCISLPSVCTLPSCLLHSEPNADSWVFVFVIQTYICDSLV